MVDLLKRLMAEATFTHELEREDEDPRGCFDSGEPDEDEKTIAWIYGQLNSGNQAAWCCLKVTAEWEGFTASTCLGGCSYESEANLLECCLADLKETACEYLEMEIGSTVSRLEKAGIVKGLLT